MGDAGRGSTTSRALGLMAFAIAGLLLAGCSTTPTSANAHDSIVTPSSGAQGAAPAASAPAQAAEPDVTTPAVGATLATEGEVASAKDAGLGVYTTTSGAKVAIDKAAPLPAAIVADIRAAVGSMAAAPTDMNAMEAQADARSAVYSAANAAGKTVVFVAAGGRYGQDNTLEESWFSIGTTDRDIVAPGTGFGSAAEALAAAQAAVATQANPSAYEIIDLTV